MKRGEDFLAVFKPEFAVFLRRTLLAGAATLVPFVMASMYLEDSNIIYAGMALVIAFIVTFDLQKWLQMRQDSWVLKADQLVYNDQDGETAIPLAMIITAHRKLWWSVQLSLQSGQEINMSYLAKPNLVAQHIMSTRELFLKATP